MVNHIWEIVDAIQGRIHGGWGGFGASPPTVTKGAPKKKKKQGKGEEKSGKER